MKPLWHYIDDWRGLIDTSSDAPSHLLSILDEQELINYLVTCFRRQQEVDDTWYRILYWFFLNNRSDLIRAFLTEYAAVCEIADTSPTTCHRLLQLQMMGASDVFLTPEALAVIESKLAGSDRLFHRRGVERLRYGVKLRKTAGTIPVVSLGQDCLPWTLLNHWHIRLEADLSQIVGPFDLAGHGSDALPRLLASDFREYTDASSFGIVNTPSGARMAVLPRLRTGFNHHLSEYWLENNFLELLTFLKQRVDVLVEGLSNEALFYLYHSKSISSAEEAVAFVEAMSRRPDTPGRLLAERPMLILNTDPSLEACFDVVTDHCCFAVVPRPDASYLWHREEHYTEDAGVAFERAIIDCVIKAQARSET